MSEVHALALIAGVGALAIMLELLRRGQLREKYVALWLFLGFGVAVLSVFPGLLDRVARWLGIADGVNLLLFAGLWVLLLVVVHLSWELSRLEDETRTLAEEIAYLQLCLEDSTGSPGGRETDPPGRPTGGADAKLPPPD